MITLGSPIDLTNEKYGRLTVIKKAFKVGTHWKWICKCDCGKEVNVYGTSLRSGVTKSCGCLFQDVMTKHSQCGTRLYRIWDKMRDRCNNPKHPSYKNYGEKGIEVCDEWLDFSTFYEWSTKNGYNDDLSIDRIENDKGYHPDNCRWATKLEQENNRTNNVFVTINGITNTLAEWSRHTSISYDAIRSRYRKGDRGERLIRPLERKRS